MNNFNFYSPTEFVFGRKTENSIADYIKNIMVQGFGAYIKIR